MGWAEGDIDRYVPFKAIHAENFNRNMLKPILKATQLDSVESMPGGL
jgi:hypothetical protein